MSFSVSIVKPTLERVGLTVFRERSIEKGSYLIPTNFCLASGKNYSKIPTVGLREGTLGESAVIVLKIVAADHGGVSKMGADSGGKHKKKYKHGHVRFLHLTSSVFTHLRAFM